MKTVKKTTVKKPVAKKAPVRAKPVAKIAPKVAVKPQPKTKSSNKWIKWTLCAIAALLVLWFIVYGMTRVVFNRSFTRECMRAPYSEFIDCKCITKMFDSRTSTFEKINVMINPEDQYGILDKFSVEDFMHCADNEKIMRLMSGEQQ
ncbi:hypothetical protein LJC18_03625 [Lachnospiraceae bacterium OttesenSCG-928-E19]|nr:hypothetical protein [Lachnospiraceae bacterium OttesenSCG-928-E19]